MSNVTLSPADRAWIAAQTGNTRAQHEAHGLRTLTQREAQAHARLDRRWALLANAVLDPSGLQKIDRNTNAGNLSGFISRLDAL